MNKSPVSPLRHLSTPNPWAASHSPASPGGRDLTTEDAAGHGAGTRTPFSDPAPRHGRLRAGLAAGVVATLAVVSGGGVLMASASHSEEVDTASRAVSSTRPDTSRAVPEIATAVNGAVQAGSGEATNPRASAKEGSVAALDSRGSTVSRNAVRTELDKAMTRSMANQRTTSMADDGSQILENASQVTERTRADEINADIARVKAQAAKIAAEKKAAEAKLAAQDPSGAAVTSVVGTDGSATTPIAPGSYTLGAYWGQRGVWARYHTGEDFVAACGTPIRAVRAGVVGQSTGGSWAGNHVVIHHAGGESTLYAHMTTKVVSPGTAVKAGQLIGYVGQTGHALGCHLHFEYYPKGTTPGSVYQTTDPLVYLRSLGVRP